jgi:hypothetical protein
MVSVTDPYGRILGFLDLVEHSQVAISFTEEYRPLCMGAMVSLWEE